MAKIKKKTNLKLKKKHTWIEDAVFPRQLVDAFVREREMFSKTKYDRENGDRRRQEMKWRRGCWDLNEVQNEEKRHEKFLDTQK